MGIELSILALDLLEKARHDERRTIEVFSSRVGSLNISVNGERFIVMDLEAQQYRDAISELAGKGLIHRSSRRTQVQFIRLALDRFWFPCNLIR